MIRSWRLGDATQTLVLVARDEHLPEVVYWGPALPADDDAALAAAHVADLTGGMLDATPALSICPEAARSFPGQPGLIVASEDGRPLAPSLRFVRDAAGPGTLALDYADRDLGLDYRATFAIDPATRVVTVGAVLSAPVPVRLHWLAAPVFPAAQSTSGMIDVAGRWCGEFQLNRVPWSPGIRLRESLTGRTGHEHFPGLVLVCPDTTNTAGEAFGFHYGWSGGHRMVAEELPDGRRQVQFGHAAHSQRSAARTFATAPLFAVYSAEGLNGLATAFQRHVRDRIVTWPRPERPRPVHYNCWEAVYFDHRLPVLTEIAARAAELGAERFVLDDGWFGTRDDDTRSLGDWTVDPRKFPDGLQPLIDHVHRLGMTFGLWVEPEMINEDSDTYRAHPDWALGPADQILGRHQRVLDLSRGDVREAIAQKIGALLSQYPIDYLKWDHNRVLPAPDAAQTDGTYALLDGLREKFPEVEIESCASGGGRIDFGILARTQRVWLSDSNDALERLRIQHDAALFLPAAVTGSHVGPRTCHTSGRVLDIRFRAWVAAQRHLGFEMDPRELTADEAAVLKRVTSWWKANRDFLIGADLLRLDSADPAVVAEQHLAPDASRFVVFAGKAQTSAQIMPRPLRLTRLAPDAHYRVSLVNADEMPRLSRGSPALKTGSVTLSGQALMSHGVMLPFALPETMWVVEGQRL